MRQKLQNSKGYVESPASISGHGGIKMASASTSVANEPAKDLILVHTVQLKSIIKAHFSGRMVVSGINDVAFASIYSEKTRLKKLIIGERARHSQVCSIENRGYILLLSSERSE